MGGVVERLSFCVFEGGGFGGVYWFKVIDEWIGCVC